MVSNWPWGRIDHGVTLTMGSYWPWSHIDRGVILTPLKIHNKSTVCCNVFSPNNILQHGLYSHIDRQTRLCLGTLEYTEADREIYRKCITKPKQHSTTLHLSVSHYFTHSIIICISLFITVRYVTVRTAQNLTKQNLYNMEGTVGSIWPQAEINTNKK
jgi:hypothetical protein